MNDTQYPDREATAPPFFCAFRRAIGTVTRLALPALLLTAGAASLSGLTGSTLRDGALRSATHESGHPGTLGFADFAPDRSFLPGHGESAPEQTDESRAGGPDADQVRRPRNSTPGTLVALARLCGARSRATATERTALAHATRLRNARIGLACFHCDTPPPAQPA